jgi:hypothetical protein
MLAALLLSLWLSLFGDPEVPNAANPGNGEPDWPDVTGDPEWPD